MRVDPEQFDITCRRPQVVLFGNGLNYNEKFKWAKLLYSVEAEGFDRSPFCSDCSYSSEDKIDERIPFSIYASISSPVEDNIRSKNIINQLEKYDYTKLDHLKRIADIAADAYLTTNYTYDLEASIKKDVQEISSKTISKYRKVIRYSKSFKGTSEKYLLHTYNSFRHNGIEKKIWHIHGDMKVPNSMILTLDDYARHIGKLVECNALAGNKYDKFSSSLKITSWMDYFIVADIYILGLGFDYSEFDLWWLLARRQREKDQSLLGKIRYYDHDNTEGNKMKHKMLQSFGVDVQTIPLNCDGYDAHYTACIDAIERDISI